MDETMTPRPDSLLDVLLDDALLTLDELCRAAAVESRWVRQRIDDGLLPAPAAGAFDAPALRRVRRMVSIERDFGADAELAALVADLQDEIDRLRARLRRAGGPMPNRS